ncbi:TonB-dependent siderophore receptor [Pedobacter sp. HMWF019]|uniref:TonB-dependent receptor n=1 Tax=Pedobacter sp. HMWF019 TaxID=2056856 RepID=UPI000D36A318|nr:TonB-dependent receptor [Pedobacter sp. HMWF019]PTS97751.1 TonB-dependent siderophore receptor [Pedobacter sp. HMWF019]
MKASLAKLLVLPFLMVLTLMSSLNAVFAQSSTGIITGAVTTNDNKPASGVSIKVAGSSKSTLANEDGYFEIKNLLPGHYELKISLVGYQTQQEKVTVQAGKTSNVSIQLKLSKNQLNEVVVTSGHAKFAKKETEYVARMPLKNLENPQVYSVISNEVMKEQIVVDYKSALRNAAGTSTLLQAANGRAYTFMRGFITGNFIRNGVSAYQYSAIDPANVDRIEVIKGPSGTLFGSSMVSYGGLVNRVTKKPFDTAHTEISYTGGSFGLNRITADINSPVSEDKRALLRINTAFHSQGSFMDSGFERNYLIAPSFTYKVNDRLSFNVEAELYQRHTAAISSYDFQNTALWANKSLKDVGLGYNRSYSSNDVDTRLLNYNVYLQANYKISDQWTSQTLYTVNGVDAPEQYFMNPIVMSGDSLQRSVGRLSDRYHTLQIQQNFNGDLHIGSVRNRILVGLDYTGYVQDPNYYLSSKYDVINYKLPATPFISKADLQKALDTIPASPSDQRTNNYAAYAADVINVTDRLIAMLSLRIDHYQDKGTRDLNSGITAGGFSQTKLSPKLGLIYQLLKDQLSVFGNYQNGFSYGYGQKSQDGKLFKPEQAYQYEGGVKLETFSNRLSATLSYYNILVKDKLRADPTNPNFSVQDATQSSKGIEAELIANPFSGFNIMLGYAYNKSVYTKADADVQGKRPYSTPLNMFNGWASYTISRGILKGAGIGAGGNYASKSFFDDSNTLLIPSFVVLGATAFYDRPSYRIGLKADNLSNEQYWGPFGQAQMPRSFSANFTVKF